MTHDAYDASYVSPYAHAHTRFILLVRHMRHNPRSGDFMTTNPRRLALYNYPRCSICGGPMLAGQKLVHLSCRQAEQQEEPA